MNTHRDNVWTLLAGQLGRCWHCCWCLSFSLVTDAAQPGGGRFSSLRNLQTMLVSSAPVVVGALGMTVVIIAGGIDLSAGTAIALCATVMAWVLKQGGPIEAGPGLLCADRLRWRAA